MKLENPIDPRPTSLYNQVTSEYVTFGAGCARFRKNIRNPEQFPIGGKARKRLCA
jgi:hypothetical protein